MGYKIEVDKKLKGRWQIVKQNLSKERAGRLLIKAENKFPDMNFRIGKE